MAHRYLRQFIFYFLFLIVALSLSFALGLCDDYIRFHDLIAVPETDVIIDGVAALDMKLPSSLVVSPDGKYAYIADAYAPAAIAIVDISTMRQISRIELDEDFAISALAMSKQSVLYAALSNDDHGMIVKLLPTTGKEHGNGDNITKTDELKNQKCDCIYDCIKAQSTSSDILTDKGMYTISENLYMESPPIDLAVDTVGQTLFVITEQQLYRIAIDGLDIIKKFNVGRSLSRIHSSMSGKFFITDTVGKSITMAEATSNATILHGYASRYVPWDVTTMCSQDGNASDPHECKDERLFVAQFYADNVNVFSVSALEQPTSIFTGASPMMLESVPDRDMVIVLRIKSAILLSIDSNELSVIKAFNLTVPSPRCMAVTPDSSTLLVTADNGNVYFIPTKQFMLHKPEPSHIRPDKFVLLFDLDKATIKPEYIPLLDELADRIKIEHKQVEIDGYTCNLGTVPHNDRLSMQRAMAVRRYLESKGLAKKYIVIRGFGDSNPYMPNVDEQNRKLNRRVEIIIK